jgi:hypothetical protein
MICFAGSLVCKAPYKQVFLYTWSGTVLDNHHRAKDKSILTSKVAQFQAVVQLPTAPENSPLPTTQQNIPRWSALALGTVAVVVLYASTLVLVLGKSAHQAIWITSLMSLASHTPTMLSQILLVICASVSKMNRVVTGSILMRRPPGERTARESPLPNI